MADAIHLAFGREKQVSFRYLLMSTGVSLLVVGAKFVGFTAGGPQFLFSGVVATFLLVLVTMALGAAHARDNEGLLICIGLAFLPALAEREFDVVFGVGHPTPGAATGVWLAVLFAVPIGVVSFVLGRRS